MIASLPMYDHAGARDDHDALWAVIRDRLQASGIDAPAALTRSGDPWQEWRRDDLLLSQTCGLPYRAELHKRLSLVAAPAFRFGHDAASVADPENPPPGTYYSVIVVRQDDPRRDFAAFDGARLAYNDPLSQSGWGLLSAHAARQGVRFGSGVQTGAHSASAQAVADGQADIAAIDVATWCGPLRAAPARAGLRILDRTALSPGLPYVTAVPDLAGALFDALQGALSYPDDVATARPALQERLNIAPEGVVPADRADYMAIALPGAPPPPAETIPHCT